MTTIREEVYNLFYEELINKGSTHENAPNGHDCHEECEVSYEDVILASNPYTTPIRSSGKKHKKCEECWKSYIDELTEKIEHIYKKEVL